MLLWLDRNVGGDLDRLPETSCVCSLAGIIKQLKGGGGELTAHGVLGAIFDGLKYSQTWSHRLRVT